MIQSWPKMEMTDCWVEEAVTTFMEDKETTHYTAMVILIGCSAVSVMTFYTGDTETTY